jgi:hypothetical protein
MAQRKATRPRINPRVREAARVARMEPAPMEAPAVSPAKIEIGPEVVRKAARSIIERAVAKLGITLDDVKRYEDQGDDIVIVTRAGKVKRVQRGSLDE